MVICCGLKYLFPNYAVTMRFLPEMNKYFLLNDKAVYQITEYSLSSLLNTWQVLFIASWLVIMMICNEIDIIWYSSANGGIRH